MGNEGITVRDLYQGLENLANIMRESDGSVQNFAEFAADFCKSKKTLDKLEKYVIEY